MLCALLRLASIRFSSAFSIAILVVAVSAQEQPRLYNDRITPHWFSGNTKFWYENALPGGAKEFVVIDAERGTRERAEKRPETNGAMDALRAESEIRPSARDGEETTITFQNHRTNSVELVWIDTAGAEHNYGNIPPGGTRELRTYAGHVWATKSRAGEVFAVFEAAENPSMAIIDPGVVRQPRAPVRPSRRKEQPPWETSPDGQWRLFIKESNLFIQSLRDQTERALSQDGSEGSKYGRASWSPDSKTVVAFRMEPGDQKEVYLIESSPKEGGRAKFQRRPYALPGDKFPKYEVNIFDVASGRQVKPQVDPYEHEWQSPQVHWRRAGTHFAYQQVDRGHQRLRVIEIDVQDARVRNLVDEKSETFIWTAHTEGLNLNLVNWLEKTDEMIYVSESSGWRQLYLVDASAGSMRPITTGEWVIRGIDQIDEAARQVWFRASGVYPGQDPYLVHYGRINFDGSNLVFLTKGDGQHTIQFSPDRQFIIDTYSRVDAAPVNELRRTADGTLICALEQADTRELEAIGWQNPEVFRAKGRDGKTDIYGIICRPRDLDPTKKYPVLEDIYAGPQGSFVPKTFSVRPPYEEFTKLGFVVVKIDGMGTANRSKSFHDVCWKNLKDAGFEDRILWMKAAAKQYPYLDLSRVGIYGTSAGGQNAAAAVLFHPEFYKAAVANCGCHDNRMDKASWNEQWMGYPVGPQYAECSNIEHAGNLKGALFLIVGELDTNVPPESTLRFADSLIKAGKDFELLVVPGADHGVRGPATSYVQRRTADFFLKNLNPHGVPNRNAE